MDKKNTITFNYNMHAVKQNGYALRFINEKEQTFEICLEAVKENGLALKYVKEKTQQICMTAFKQNSLAIKYMDPVILNLIILSNKKSQQNIIYEDIVANTCSCIENADNTINAIAKYIEIKHGTIFAKQILDANENPLLIDEKYIGFYVKKQNDYLYELHIRELQKKNNGWIMNNFVDVIIDTLIGKFFVTQ